MTRTGGVVGRTRPRRSRPATVPIAVGLCALVLVLIGGGTYVAITQRGGDAREVALQSALEAYERGEYLAAESQLTNLIDDGADGLEARKALALALSAQGKNDQAIAQYEAVIASDEKDDDSLYRMAVLERLIGRTGDALTHLEAAADIERETLYLDELARTYLQVGRFDDAIQMWTMALQDDGLEDQRKAEMLGALADAYSNTRRYEDAKGALVEALALAPNDKALAVRLEALGD
ncbi:MAG: tetratricopeptide repeat protein [Coriobacteriia bacterium]